MTFDVKYDLIFYFQENNILVTTFDMQIVSTAVVLICVL